MVSYLDNQPQLPPHTINQPSIYPSIHVSNCLSIYLSIYISIYMYIYPYSYLSICLSILMFIYTYRWRDLKTYRRTDRQLDSQIVNRVKLLAPQLFVYLCLHFNMINWSQFISRVDGDRQIDILMIRKIVHQQYRYISKDKDRQFIRYSLLDI